MAGFVVSAPVVATVAALATRSPSEAARVWGALLTIAALYVLRHPGREPPWSRATLGGHLQEALMRLEVAVYQSAIVELPIIGPPLELVLSLAVVLVGVWLPIVVAIVITSVV